MKFPKKKKKRKARESWRRAQEKRPTVMESDLSSSDAALRMLLVEDVELLESGILASSADVKQCVLAALLEPCLCAHSFSLSTQVSPLFMGVICLRFLTSNALIPPLVNQRTGSDAYCRGSCVRACVHVLGVGGGGGVFDRILGAFLHRIM